MSAAAVIWIPSKASIGGRICVLATPSPAIPTRSVREGELMLMAVRVALGVRLLVLVFPHQLAPEIVGAHVLTLGVVLGEAVRQDRVGHELGIPGAERGGPDLLFGALLEVEHRGHG